MIIKRNVFNNDIFIMKYRINIKSYYNIAENYNLFNNVTFNLENLR